MCRKKMRDKLGLWPSTRFDRPGDETVKFCGWAANAARSWRHTVTPRSFMPCAEYRARFWSCPAEASSDAAISIWK